MKSRFAFRYPETTGDAVWTDEALAGLVGQRVMITLNGAEIGPGRIVDAYRYTDKLLGPGVWIEAESIDAYLGYTDEQARIIADTGA